MEHFYQYKPSTRLVNTRGLVLNGITSQQIDKFFKDRSYRQVEDCIIQSLFFHPYLTKANIVRYVNAKMKGQKREDYSNTLKRMWKDGAIERFQYGAVMLYTLSNEAYDYSKQKYKNVRKREFVRPDIENTDKVLECACLAQFHLSLFTGEKLRRSHFYENSRIGNTTLFLPSYTEFKKQDYIYHVYGTVLPETEHSFDGFFYNIKRVSDILHGKIKYSCKDIFLYIIIVPDLVTIKTVAGILLELPDTAGMAFYFVLEEQTIHTTGLTLLYSCQKNGNDIEIETLTFPTSREVDFYE